MLVLAARQGSAHLHHIQPTSVTQRLNSRTQLGTVDSGTTTRKGPLCAWVHQLRCMLLLNIQPSPLNLLAHNGPTAGLRTQGWDLNQGPCPDLPLT